MNINHEISTFNDKFATTGSKLKIELRGEKLNIRGPLPSKNNKNISKVQRISLGLKANSLGFKEAQKKMQLINLQLELNQFEWSYWTKKSEKKNKKSKEIYSDKVEEFEIYFFREPKNEFLSSTRKTTWESSYRPYLKRFLSIHESCKDKDLTNVFFNTLNTYEKGSRSRKQCGTSLNVFADFLGHKLPIEWKEMSRGYGLKKASFRDLPNDNTIKEIWANIPNKSWQYVFALMATYGLRNHEVFFCDLSSVTLEKDKIIRVLPTTKTGEHQVWPFHPDWVEIFGLYKLGNDPNLLPKINLDLSETTLQRIGKKITDQFNRYKLPIKPYDLRHAWAVRTIFYNLPDTVAARMMGHSVSVHTQTYHHWITKRDQQQAVNNALLNYEKKE